MNFLFIWRFNCRLLVSFVIAVCFYCLPVSAFHEADMTCDLMVHGMLREMFVCCSGETCFFFSGDFSTFLDEMWRVHVRRLLLMFVYICGEKKRVTIQTSFCKKKNPRDLLTSSRILSTLWWLHSVCAVLSSSLSLPQTGIFARFLLWSLRGAPSRGLWRHLC